jgi:hypothetical protein
MPDITDDEENFIKEGERIENELGFKQLDGFQLFNGQAHYGVVVTDINQENENDPDINNIKAYTTAPSPLHVMVDVWQSLFHQSISAGLGAMSRFIGEVREESAKSDTEVLDRIIGMLADEDFHMKFISNLFGVQPDVIVIGNPNVLANFQVSSFNQEEFSKSVEEFLKEVTEKKDEEE